MATPPADENLRAALPSRCLDCGAPLAGDQRYCVECGVRRGPLAPAIAELIGALPVAGSPLGELDGDWRREGQSPEDEFADSEQEGWLEDLSLPSPPAAAVAVMGPLAFGVLVGSAVSPTEPSSASAPVLVAYSPAPASTTPGSPTPAGNSAPGSSTTGSTTPAGSSAPGSTTPSGTAPAGSTAPGSTSPGGAGAATPAGGGRVGLLLISSFVKPGTTNTIDDYNHFSLLGSIEDLFSLQHLGYAGAPGLLVFDKTVYNTSH